MREHEQQSNSLSLGPAQTNSSDTSSSNQVINTQNHNHHQSIPVLKQSFLESADETPKLRWRVWYQLFQDHLTVQGLDTISDNRKLALLRTSLGAEGFRICSELCTGNISFTETVQRLEQRFAPRASQIYDRAQFNMRIQHSGESSLQFVTVLRTLAATCGYPDNMRDQLIRDRFVAGCSDHKIRERLLLENNDLTLENSLTIAQNLERAVTESSSVNKPGDSCSSVFKIHHQSPSTTPARDSRSRNSSEHRSFNRHQSSSKPAHTKKCWFCGGAYPHKGKCPAKGQKCTQCGRFNHLASVCHSSKQSNHSSYHSSANSSRSSSPFQRKSNVSVINALTSQSERPFKYIQCVIGGQPTQLLIDIGAKVSVLNKDFLDSLEWQPVIKRSQQKLSTYTGDAITTVGQVLLPVLYGSTTINSFTFHVVRNGENLMGVDLFDRLGFHILDHTSTTISTVQSSSSIQSILHKYPEIARYDPTKKIKFYSHLPNINPDIPFTQQKLRRLPQTMLDPVCKKLKQMEADGILERIDSSPCVSNMVVVKKPDGDLRICNDLSDVNKAVIPDTYPLPTIDELSEFFAGATVFSKIDLKWGYLQVELAPESRYLTAMITPIGLFQWRRLPFGLSSAPSCFQKIVANIIDGCQGTRNLLDDILVSGRSNADHDGKLETVLKRLNEYNATINTAKCKFGVEKVEFVGHTISSEGVQPLHSNVEGIMNILEPANKKELQSFLGAANYYRKFVSRFAERAEPLHQLLKKDVEWVWSRSCSDAFNDIKRAIASEQVLCHFHPNARTIVSTDASGVALGAVLSQMINGEERPVAFASRSLSPAERAYSASEREALACIWACEHWHYFLYGRKFTLRTDHSSLATLLAGSNKGRKPMRLLRWADRLQQYNYDIVYRSGSENQVPDVLSRYTVSEPVRSDTSELEIESKQIATIFGSPTLRAIQPKELADATAVDPILKIVNTAVYAGWPKKKPEGELKSYYLLSEEISCVQGCLYREQRAIIPSSLRTRILQLAHEGHPGIVRTKSRLREAVWWPNIEKDVEQFVKSCTSCIMADKSCRPAIPPVKPIPYPSKPWEKLSIDIIGELHGCPQSHRFVIVLIDLHSKWPEIKPVTTITSSAVITFLSDMFTRWGLPREIISDNGKQFTSREFEDFLSGLGIKHCKTALYHPQSNGAVERFNRVLKEGLRGGKSSNQPIEVTLRSILASYLSIPHSTTGVSPAELMIGRQLRTPLDLLTLSHKPRRVRFEDEQIRERVQHKQEQYKSNADRRHHAHSTHLQASDQVRVHTPVRASKLDPAYSVPKTIISKPNTDTARLDDGTTWNAAALLPVQPEDFDDTVDILYPAPEQFRDRIQQDVPIPDVMQPDPIPVLPEPIQQNNQKQSQKGGRAAAAADDLPMEPLRRATRNRHRPAGLGDFVMPDVLK